MSNLNINFYVSNDIESLSLKWIENSKYHKNVFQPHIILTQTQGMNNWLKLQRVKSIGNSTNLHFTTPNDFLMSVYDDLHVNATKKISNKNIDLLIYKIISENEFQNKFKDITLYFKHKNKNIQELRQWELAYQTADLIDQYQIYRQDTLKKWLTHDDIDSKFEWQQYIWRRLHDILEDKLIDLTQLKTDVFELLNDPKNQNKLIQKYPHISLFGISILSPYHIQVLYRLAEIIQVDIYLLNPAPEIFWDMDISESESIKKNIQNQYAIGHELLTNWGRLIQQTFRLMNKDDLLINTSEILLNEKEKPSTFLNALKNTIHNNDISFQNWQVGEISDESVYICSHYSIQNEITCLYNYIVDITQNNSDIQDSDILIICSDIDAYAPSIRAIFNASDVDIKYSIADENLHSGDNIISSLLDILDFDFNKFSAEDVFKLLEHQSIKSKFSLHKTHHLKNIILQLNIRYGMQNQLEDDTYLVSWMHGMKKCLLNICIDEEDFYVYNNTTYALNDTVDQNEDILAISHLFDFIDKMMTLSKRINQSMNLTEWKSLLIDTIQNFLYEEGEQFINQYEAIINQLSQLETIDELIQHEKISFRMFSHRLKTVLRNISSEGKFMRRGITFCSPIPFRSVPFKVIGFLGLNNDTFPRKHNLSNINYITQNPQLGDRNIKNNDKHLFLESLLSAQEKFYISYIGKNRVDNSILPPSILIDELMDYIQTQVSHDYNVRDIMIKSYPLNNYSYKYNTPDSHLLPNYIIKKSKDFIPFIKKADESEESKTINWAELKYFITNPVKFYFTKNKKIFLELNNQDDVEHEKISLSSLENHIYKSIISDKTEEEILEWYKHVYLNGEMPLKNIGEVHLHHWMKKIQFNNKILNEKIDASLHQKIKIDMEFNSYKINAVIDLYDNHLVEINESNSNLKSKIELFLNHILLKSQGIENTALLVSEGEIFTMNPMSEEISQNHLLDALEFFYTRQKTLIPADHNLKLNEANVSDPNTFVSSYKYSNSGTYNKYFKYVLDNYDFDDTIEEIITLKTKFYKFIDSKFIN